MQFPIIDLKKGGFDRGMDYSRHILVLTDKQLEQFVHRWARASAVDKYFEVQVFGDAGDKGRDVVGFVTDRRHEGPWDNFQCKQLGRPLQTSTALLDIGKIIYFSYLGAFSLPRRFTFVAPRGTARRLEDLIYNPSELKKALIRDWHKYCRTKIVANQAIELQGELLTHFEKFNFSSVSRMTLDDILADEAVRGVLVAHFNADPPAPPPLSMPPHVAQMELPYVNELVEAYGEREGRAYANHLEITSHPDHGIHFKEQRERFYEADQFSRFYRDNTLVEEMESLQSEVYHGIIEKHRETHKDRLARISAVMQQAASISPTGVLAKHARVPVRQGICHIFVNDGKLTWRR